MKRPDIFILTVIFLILSSIINAQDFEKELEKIARDAKGRVGAGIMLAETGKSSWLNAREPFPMQSVYKLPISMAMLSKVDSGLFSLDSMILVKKEDLIGKRMHSPIRDQNPAGNFYMSLRDLLRYALSESDGTASDVLMRLCGGPRGVMNYLSSLGIKDMHILNTEKQMGEDNSIQYKNSSTPRAAIRLLLLLWKGGLFKTETEKLLFKDITETPTGLNRIKGMLPKGTITAHKTGTSGTVNGVTAATNDIGIVNLPDGRHLLLAVFVSDSKARDNVRDSVIARIAKAGWDKYVK